MNKDEYMDYVDQGIADFNLTFNLKNGFINRELEKLERIVDKTSCLPEHLRMVMFKDLNEEVREQLKESTKQEAFIKENNGAKIETIFD